jgi:hypothetical protein
MLARLSGAGLCQTHLDVALHIGSASAAVLTLFGQIVVVRSLEPPRSGPFCQNLGGLLCRLSCYVVFGSVQSSDRSLQAPGHGGLGRLAKSEWILVVHEMPPPSSAPMFSFSGGSAAIYSCRSHETAGNTCSKTYLSLHNLVDLGPVPCSSHQIPNRFSRYLVVHHLSV